MSTNSSAPVDLRVRRTHKLLSDALVALLEEQPFESITVRQICERAMVHRATFYTHYTDKYDLLKAVLNDLQADLLGILTSEQRPDKRRRFYPQLIEYVVAHRSLFSLLLVEKEANSLTAMMRQQIAMLTEMQVQDSEHEGMRYRVPVPIMTHFFAGAVLAVIAWWLENDRPISAEALTHHLDALLNGQYEAPR